MNRLKITTLLLCLSAVSAVSAQEDAANLSLPRKVSNVEILNLEGKAAKLPCWGEKNLMIFYVDPDHHKQNEEFTYELEKNHRAQSDEIYGFGVMNLKDAPMVPNGMARMMARKRTETNGATVLADQDRTLSRAWELGDCNNQFVLLFVNKAGELVFMRKGQLSEADKEAFYEVLDTYK
ncbi:hypothetical protein [uncultured Alistipes sp.]|uniref:hypothetical protein n=1 Tax=uncultured Alistipes sp. TaxID=538949 RepID=UPI00261DE2EC|nr:hypothetical protein [uncultured Alistipes sp.]